MHYNDKLIDDLKRVAKLLNKSSVTIDEYNQHGNFHNTTLSRRFGGWLNALEKAGLDRTRNLNISNEDYFKNLEDVWIKLGRQPKYLEMNKPLSKYCVGAYEYKFGSWTNALEAFISYANSNEEEDSTEHKNHTKEKNKALGKSRNPNLRLRFKVMQRDNFKCTICGRSPASQPNVVLHIDHIKPWSKGGETVIKNLTTLCSKCNIGKSNLDE